MLLLFLNTRRADMKCISYFAAALCLAVVAGCGGGGDPEQEEHAHHEFPDHRPGNYKEAVSAISQRSWELANRGGKIGSLEFGHFVDIITWVPEMAADSDMRKADWDKANDAAGKTAGAGPRAGSRYSTARKRCCGRVVCAEVLDRESRYAGNRFAPS